jgi:uncharacterized protein
MLQVTGNLISLERGGDELLLVNSYEMRPLYFKRGRDRLKRIIAAAHQPCAVDELESTFPNDKALIKLLRDYGILVDTALISQAEDVATVARAHEHGGNDRVTLYLLLGESCNLACVYCLNGARTYDRSGRTVMSEAVASQSIEMCLSEVRPGGLVDVAFFGGEPLIYWDLVKQIILHCEETLKPAHPDKAIRYNLTSNLTIKTPDLVEWAKRYDITVVGEVDGPPDIHNRCRPNRGGAGSHAQTARAIRELVEAGVKLTLRATITRANDDRLDDVAEHHTELGAASSLFVPVRPINSDEEFFSADILPNPDTIIAAALKLRRADKGAKRNLFPFNDFLAEIHPGERQTFACGAPGGATFVARANGDIYPCIYLVGQQQYRIGNVGAGTLDFRPLEEMRAALHVDQRDDCRTCAWRYVCGGGCPVLYLARNNGAADHPKVAEYSRRITCELSQAIIADMLWELADRGQNLPKPPKS